MKKVEYKGETFQLDDSKGCYIEVTYRNLVGYVGISLQLGTEEKPYAWWVPEFGGSANSVVTKDGLTTGAGEYEEPTEALHILYNHLIHKYQEDESRKAFKPEIACEALHEYVKGLPGGD